MKERKRKRESCVLSPYPAMKVETKLIGAQSCVLSPYPAMKVEKLIGLWLIILSLPIPLPEHWTQTDKQTNKQTNPTSLSLLKY